ncbi:MAG: hypothetical protein VZR33_03615 [Methanosphaera sp.]|nr:hypothetical protein [Methanosphaera sp.]
MGQSIDRGSSNIRIQDLVNLVGGIAQLGSSIQQLQNIGDIWANNNLNAGQKFLQIITNLSFSFPMLISGLQRASLALGLFKTA